jgi:hypothetical protein
VDGWDFRWRRWPHKNNESKTEAVMHDLDRALVMVREAARAVRETEAKAQAALHGQNDPATHRALMVAKCEILMELPAKVAPHLTGTGGEALRLQTGLDGFARRAGQALELESIFYMSALLYPEDYKDGDPNDLERFVAGFAGP